MQRGSQSMPDLYQNGTSNTDAMHSRRRRCESRISFLRDQADSSNLDFLKQHYKLPPFNLRWIHGYNLKVGVINLNTQGSTLAFYAATNCGVLYNWTTHHMHILQGHKHVITSIASDKTGEWLVTADSGPENVIIIWCSRDLFPQKTIFSPHGLYKTSKVALSADAKYLLTIACSAEKVFIHWWIWSFGLDTPHATAEIELTRENHSIIAISFNPFLSTQFILLSKTELWLGIAKKVIVIERGVPKETGTYELIITNPFKDPISPEYGSMTCFTCVEKTRQILVATGRGAVLVYGYNIEYNENIENSNNDFEKLRYIKTLHIEKRRINVIKSIDNVIVTGNTIGQLHFYDDQLKLLYWLHELPVNYIKDISFNISPRNYEILDPKGIKTCVCWEKIQPELDPSTGIIKQKLLKKKIPIDATTSGQPFLVRNFIICTSRQGVRFMDFVKKKIETVIDSKVSPIISMSVHPEKSLLSLGHADGTVELYNFLQHSIIKRLNLREYFTIAISPRDDSIHSNVENIVPILSVTCLQYSPSGMHLACGLNTGALLFLDPCTIEIITPKPFKDVTNAIQMISFSLDSLSLAMADLGKTVCVYKYDCATYKWVFIGKHRTHYDDIVSLIFLSEKRESGDYKLLSLGKDRIMVEYDIGSSTNECLEIFSLDRIEQAAVPLAGIEWPTPVDLDPEVYRTDLPMIFIASNEYKYKVMNYATTMTLSTVLGPRYETPVSKIFLLNKKEGDENLQYLLFSTKDVIGLQKLPLDGNPWKHAGMLGHPVKILKMDHRQDLGILFTIGEKDTTMIQWAINLRSVEASAECGGGDLDPYYCLLESSREGWLFQEIRDLFYYIQILCQGIFSPAMRRIKDYIPIDSLSDLMRALGFFPSEYEVENLIAEAKYKVYLRKPVTEIDFEEFVKLYLNHRPAFGEDFKQIRSSFKYFAEATNDKDYIMTRDDFIEMLTDNGEHFSRELLWYLLSILCRHSLEDRAVLTQDDFSFLPEEITFSSFVDSIIGIQQDFEDVAESCVGSTVSVNTCTSEQSEDSCPR